MIRTEFSSRVAAQIGVNSAKFHQTLIDTPRASETIASEPHEAVELGFEKALQFVATAGQRFKGNRAAMEAAGDEVRRQNPEAYEKVGDLVEGLISKANERITLSDFRSFNDGISAVQVKGNTFTGTLWVDTTPDDPGITSVLIDNATTHGPNPCVVPRPGQPTQNTNVDAKILAPVSQKLGADSVFTGLDDPKLTKFLDWKFERTGLPYSGPLDALPKGWEVLASNLSGGLGEGEKFVRSEPVAGASQILCVNVETGTVALATVHSYRRDGDFEGSSDRVALTRYADGEVRREAMEMHD